ncbi:IclR family transcriptional regulator [Sphingobium sp. SCG-1]|uniref:IclR family transcriptional regulator n=1 Tax=Sphingobium sp. SCG-1 TaxID=2072936 RepID=UPI00166FB8AB|nr:IclR family transcriptional regulator [Sphingobium sp. SCG-1]
MMERFRRSEERNGVEALAKGLDLFRLIADDGGQSRISELARYLAIPRTTLHRLLGELARQGMITRVGHGRYSLGITLAELEATGQFNEHLISIARSPLQRLADAHGGSAHLGVLQNAMVTYLVKTSHVMEGPDFTKEGRQLEAYCSGIGKVLLANRPADYIEAYLADGPFVPFTQHTITSPNDLEKCLVAVRHQGWASDDEEAADHLHCLAVPLGRPGRKPVAAISFSRYGIVSMGKDSNIISALRRCAEEIATLL